MIGLFALLINFLALHEIEQKLHTCVYESHACSFGYAVSFFG